VVDLKQFGRRYKNCKTEASYLQGQIKITILKLSNTYLAMLCVVTTEGNELLADWTTFICFPLADLCVLDNAFHLLTGR
jgi:hypothetical protein